MGLLELQLKALRYPHEVDLTNTDSVRKLVIWLENLKIREFKIEDRKALADTQSSSWDAAFQKYLQDLECPVPPGDMPEALRWLVSFALNLEYEDNADKLTVRGPPQSQTPAASTAKQPPAATGNTTSRDENVYTDLQDPQVVATVVQLVRAAQASAAKDSRGGLPPAALHPSTSLVEQLMDAAHQCVCELGPALRPGVWNRGWHPSQAVVSMPLGFEVEGAVLSAAAKALRLLFIRDLRQLQSQIDHAVVDMQEYTANPKTDPSLGKVGR